MPRTTDKKPTPPTLCDSTGVSSEAGEAERERDPTDLFFSQMFDNFAHVQETDIRRIARPSGRIDAWAEPVAASAHSSHSPNEAWVDPEAAPAQFRDVLRDQHAEVLSSSRRPKSKRIVVHEGVDFIDEVQGTRCAGLHLSDHDMDPHFDNTLENESRKPQSGTEEMHDLQLAKIDNFDTEEELSLPGHPLQDETD